MLNLSNLPQHPLLEQMVDDLCPTNEEYNKPFYRVIVAYFFSKMAANMRAVINAPQIGEIPVNCFAFALAPSGFGKNTVIGRIERDAMSGFRKRFTMETMPVVKDETLYNLAVDRCIISGKTEEEETQKLEKLYANAGPYPFTAKKATASAIEQLRGKLLMSGTGAINIQIDEIGMNITDKFVMEGLTLFLELYDMGVTDMVVTKNSSDNQRVDDLEGATPANLLAFGTSSKLFDGAHSEQAFMELLDTGYARRCLFAWGEKHDVYAGSEITLEMIEEMYDAELKKKTSSSVSTLAPHFTDLADAYKNNWTMDMPRDAGLRYTAYKLMCKERKADIPVHEDIRRTEMEHRHWKALKLAGALAFVDESQEVTADHILAAIGIVEESGQSLHRVLKPVKVHVKLAKYIADAKGVLTHADLYDALPYYKASQSARSELMALATAWGHKNNVVIKKTFEDGIEFFEGETLDETDTNEMIFSYSNDQAFHYVEEDTPVSFENLAQLVSAPDLHWCNHRFQDGHRKDDKAIPGFNMVVVDVDGEASLDFVHDVLSDYTFMTATTKRHTADEHRFRLIMPISHVLELNQEDYREFMDNLFLWLPFESDTAANQRSKKWLTNDKAQVHVNQGDILSALPFIPKTSKNQEYRENMKELGDLNALERWFAQRFVDGDRNNQMIRFALALLDTGMSLYEIEARVTAFNNSLANGLPEDEIHETVMKTVARKMAEAA